MTQIVFFTITAIFLYVISDWLLGKFEEYRGKPFASRNLVFFMIILVLSVTVFEGVQRLTGVPSPATTQEMDSQ